VLQSIGPKVMSMLNYDHSGVLQDWSIDSQVEIDLTRVTEIQFGRETAFERFGGIGFRRHRNYVEAESEWQKWLGFKTAYEFGRAINYEPGPRMRPFVGDFRQARAGFTLRPDPHTRFDQTYVYNQLGTGRTSIFNNHILRSKVNYQLNREASFRFIFDYNAVLPNLELADLERAKHIGVDALFTYMLNPGTALHVGYTDLFDNLRLDPTLSPALVRTGSPDLNSGRQVFVKLSYLFRF
jgi:hypothetical protein